MANTTLSNLIDTLRRVVPIPISQINYGFTSGLEPPYVNLVDLKSTYGYDTSGAKVKVSTFSIVCVGKNAAEAEATISLVDCYFGDIKNLNYITPNSIEVINDNYLVTQMADNLYQFVSKMDYELTENINGSSI